MRMTPKTAITTPFELFEFPFITFGLCNAGQTFQRFIDKVTFGLDFCFSYVDEVFSKSEELHKEHLRILFKRLSEYGIVINPSKCIIGVPEVKFLGYIVSSSGTRPSQERATAFQEYELLQTVRSLRRFLGIMNFYRRFLPKAAELQAPLHSILIGADSNGSLPVPWTPELEEAFHACKAGLSSAILLFHPKHDTPLGLCTDASGVSVGACLQQLVDNSWQPLGVFSKKLTPKQSIMPAYYRELFAIYEAVQHFRHLLETTLFTIFTNHKPLIFAFQQRRDKLPPAQLRQLSFISEFSTDIKHVSGSGNIVADALSRIEAVSSVLDHETLANSQLIDQEVQTLFTDQSTSLRLEKVAIPGTKVTLICDTSTGSPRPIFLIQIFPVLLDCH